MHNKHSGPDDRPPGKPAEVRGLHEAGDLIAKNWLVHYHCRWLPHSCSRKMWVLQTRVCCCKCTLCSGDFTFAATKLVS